ncbi:MAG TPA: CHASE2 domain-containing protein [Verrucomicrobiae bacterium]|nr:CHASE2 domain-containing protein [Verrucomicrobiae bacterium]
MNLRSTSPTVRSAIGGGLVVFVGLLLWATPAGQGFIHGSYDYLFRFGSRAPKTEIVLIQLDNEAYDFYQQVRGEPWDRGLHASLLNRLADDGCALVVFDAFFRAPRNPETDAALAAAMRRQRAMVLMAEQARVTHPEIAGARPVVPAEPFLSASRTNWGVAWLDPDVDGIVRRHWPFPAPGPYPSLPIVAATASGAPPLLKPVELWLRYYGQNTWDELSYRFALSQPQGFYRDKIVFIGSHPRTSLSGDERDEFLTPFSRWTGETTGGVEILITEFLNLKRQEGLQRLPGWIEAWLIALFGLGLGATLWQRRWKWILVTGVGAGVVLGASAIIASHASNYWFPWMIVVLAQVPTAMAWALANRVHLFAERSLTTAAAAVEPVEPKPHVPGYELWPKPFGEGAYGKVWLARKGSGPWEALKVVYLARFDQRTEPYEREFKGVNLYRRISDQHPGLLRVTHVSEKLQGYFYYVMELGDSVTPDWRGDPNRYKPRDLVNLRAGLHRSRLPAIDCIRLGLMLCEPLDFLHSQGLTHRDIKPQNIIFVDAKPKVADVGLIAEIRRADEQRSIVGTPGYMPPLPELPGTVQADIYSLGMVLYVLSTGNPASQFPEISSSMVESRSVEEFSLLNGIIVKACHPDLRQRYSCVTEMCRALAAAEAKLVSLQKNQQEGR